MRQTHVNVIDWDKNNPANKGKDYSTMSKQILDERYRELAAPASRAKLTSEDRLVVGDLRALDVIEKEHDLSKWWDEQDYNKKSYNGFQYWTPEALKKHR